ncbi:MAG: ABC-ATPase domain-containing protein [Firmicutes bacterium]|nr:ABC-ATPase domain-containing protein [Bacillota bacterium]
MPLRTREDLRQALRRIDGRGYPAYRDLEGSYDFGNWELRLDRAQPDPFASPSRFRVRVPGPAAGLPPEALATPLRRWATGDFLARAFHRALPRGGSLGSGKSGLIFIDAGEQEILPRTAVRVEPDGTVEVRFAAGLPAAGRRILGRAAEELLLERIPRAVAGSLLAGAHDRRALSAHLAAAEDHAWLQERLPAMGLVAFVADGSILPRESGVSQKPLPGAVPWVSPPELRVTVEFPNAGPVTGTGIPAGVTLIVGGGYHGKSTLLRALERGVYPHIPGDGRERVVTRADAWKLRAEDGRRVEGVDISPFIAGLPGGTDTRWFRTEAASGSTSMAANLVEALEAGAGLLLVDEDTAATNFLIRDARMQRLVPKEGEPITPFIDRVRSLYTDLGVSTVLVVGGAGDYLDVADTVILMQNYRPADVTARARQVAAELPARRQPEAPVPLSPPRPRWVDPDSLDPRRRGREKVRARDLDELAFGAESIDLSYVEQLVDPSQTRAIGGALLYALRQGLFRDRPAVAALAEALRVADEQGLEAWAGGGVPPGDWARPRLLELAAALNRLRTLRVLDREEGGRRPGGRRR